MGEEAAEPDEGRPEKLEIGFPGAELEAQRLSEAFQLEDVEGLEKLLDLLFGYSCRDQGEAPHRVDMSLRRGEGYKAAQIMRREAAKMLASLDAIFQASRRFDDFVQFNPGLLEAIFDVSTEGPGNLIIPAEIAVIDTFFPTRSVEERELFIEFHAEGLEESFPEISLADRTKIAGALFDQQAELWVDVEQRLAALASVPVKAKLERGPAPSIVVRQAVRACKGYWKQASPLTWSMIGLRDQEVRSENSVQHLRGKCEQFVAEALTVAGIRFNLNDLCAAWTAVDQADR